MKIVEATAQLEKNNKSLSLGQITNFLLKMVVKKEYGDRGVLQQRLRQTPQKTLKRN
jgi:hypothetical protein